MGTTSQQQGQGSRQVCIVRRGLYCVDSAVAAEEFPCSIVPRWGRVGRAESCEWLGRQAPFLLDLPSHAVSPATSNGMNSALEDALVLSQTLEACGGDLAALPAAFTAARLADARALLWLDAALSTVAGRAAPVSGLACGRPPSPRANKLAVVSRVILSRLTRGWVRPHALILLKDGSLPYAEARRRVERDAAIADAAASWGALAAAGAAVAVVLSVALRALRS